MSAVARHHRIGSTRHGRPSSKLPLDRKAEEAEGRFGARIADLNADIVVDMISFHLEGAQQLVEALRNKIEHYLFCSSIWVYGHATTVPSVETDPTNAIDAYGVNKAKIERWLLHQARRDGFPATSFRPGHIVGEGWVPINPQANTNPDIFSQIARGEELALPNLGLEMVHHVHADDVAQWIICAIEHRTASIGEVFNTVSAHALTLRGYAEEMYRWFEQEPRLSFAPFDQWKLGLAERMPIPHGGTSCVVPVFPSRRADSGSGINRDFLALSRYSNQLRRSSLPVVSRCLSTGEDRDTALLLINAVVVSHHY